MADVKSPRETPDPRDSLPRSGGEPVPRGDLPEPVNPGDPAQAPQLGAPPVPPGAEAARQPSSRAWWLLVGVLVLLLLLWLF